MASRKNPADSTTRNVRARRTADARLKSRIVAGEARHRDLAVKVRLLEWRLRKVEGAIGRLTFKGRAR